MHIYSEFAAYSCIKRPYGAKKGAFIVKIPRHLEKTPLKPNVLGLGGVVGKYLDAADLC